VALATQSNRCLGQHAVEAAFGEHVAVLQLGESPASERMESVQMLLDCFDIVARACALVIVFVQELLEGDTATAIELARGIG
jgi:hypothetical protein